MRGGPTRLLWFGTDNRAVAMSAGWAVAYAGYGKRHLVTSPAVAKEPNAVIALAIRGLFRTVCDLHPDQSPHVCVRMTPCGMGERFEKDNRIAQRLWEEVERLNEAHRITIEELGADSPQMVGYDALHRTAERTRDFGFRRGFPLVRPLIPPGNKTTFDRFDLPPEQRSRWALPKIASKKRKARKTKACAAAR